MLSLAHTIANGAGNFAFGPEIYRTSAKADYDVLGHFARQVDAMINDLREVQLRGLQRVPSTVLHEDARELGHLRDGIAAVITSPPYPNEKDYTRTTRVESLLLRFFSDRKDLRKIKNQLLRSNTRNVFVRWSPKVRHRGSLNPERNKRSPCPRNDASTVPI
jgi:hypothetical protein